MLPDGLVRVAPLAPALIHDPVAFLSAEHGRQLVLLAHLDRLARAPSGRGARAMAQALLDWFDGELPMHVADEERSLFPRLRPHDIGGVVDRLSRDHRRDAALAEAVLPGLRALAAGRDAGQGFAAAASEFLRQHRQHLELEESVIVPLARQVLTGAAREGIAVEIAARRGYAAGSVRTGRDECTG